MTSGGDGWSDAQRTATQRRPASADVELARRRVATFGGGGGRPFAEHMRDFIRRYGWRAYALPILLVVTVVALLTTTGGRSTPSHQASAGLPAAPAGGASSPPVAPSSIPLKSDATDGAAYQRAIDNSALPAGGAYTKTGDGTFAIVKGTSKPVGTPGGRLYRYDVEYERGIAGVNLARFATLVQSTLADPRSWSGHGVRVQRVDSGTINFHVTLTSAMTVRQFCGYDIPVETSCYAPANSSAALSVNRVVLNVARWVRGAQPYLADLNAYRLYMINHEDGHAMGHQHAHQCLPGGLAPVMMQQTFGLKSATDGKLCGANPWPYPPGAKGAPGAEQPDTQKNDEYYIGAD